MAKLKNHGFWLNLPRIDLIAVATILILFTIAIGKVSAMTRHTYDGESPGPLLKTAVSPNVQLRVHRISKVNFSITNKGIFGSQGREEIDSLTGLPAPSCTFPAGTGLEYLFQGSLWIGAVVERPSTPGVFDTLVSIGNDGWWGDIFEMFPSTPPGGNILMLSKNGVNSKPYYDSTGSMPFDLGNRRFHAVSEQDFIAAYYDTNVTSPNPDPFSGQHKPLGLRIIQKSYSWSYEYAQDFILIDFEITNIGDKSLENVWIGLYIDADVYHISEDTHNDPEAGAQDDICGFLRYFRANANDSIEINTAWIADNNGMGVADKAFFDDTLDARGVSGCRVVRTPNASLQYGFNWWISNEVATLDWSPMRRSNDSLMPALFGSHNFPGGGRGTPGGDRAKYFVMSNHEFDYDQIYCNLNDWESQGWASKSPQAADLANGYDTRYLYSFGPFDSIPAGSTLPLTVAYICGANFHNDPHNYSRNLRNSTDNRSAIDLYYSKLSFADFATNAQWAEWVYDNPGRDSCYVDGVWQADGDSGEFRWVYSGSDSVKFWYKGDGCPDFQGPPPPPPPRVEVTTDKGLVDLRWTSKNPPALGPSPEDFIDPFSQQYDFEGYGIYISYNAVNWTPLGHYDKIDWIPVTRDSITNAWVINKDKIYAISTDSVRQLDGENARFGTPGDDSLTTSRYWIAQDLNTGMDPIIESVEVLGDGDTVYHYKFTIDSMLESKGAYFAITAFDFGNPQTNLSPLESAPSLSGVLVYPIRKSDPIMVYPNPYRIDGNYQSAGWESGTGGWHEQDRRIWFSNLPDNQWAIIRIWTLDGDLVRVLTYDPRTSINNPLGVVYWDLVSRNTQAVVSGMYLYSVEYHSVQTGVPDKKSEIGKFVIIK
jgi:hypothetical protein